VRVVLVFSTWYSVKAKTQGDRNARRSDAVSLNWDLTWEPMQADMEPGFITVAGDRN
jgi:hypothetical protein